MRLHLDLEVYSEVSIKEAPLDVYASHPSTKVILCAFAFDEGPVEVYEPHTGIQPKKLFAGLRDSLLDLKELGMDITDSRQSGVTVVAWNTGYERTVIRYKGLDIPTSRCLDPMVYARYAGLPGKLKDCAKIPMIGVPAEEATKSETLLIKKFCMPNKNGVRTLPSEAPEDWALFVDYCRRDVLTMRTVLNWIEPRFPFPARERQLWELDQRINQRGIPVDVEMAKHGMSEAARIITTAYASLKELTGLENPNSVTQLHPWLADNGYPYDSLGKEFLQQALDILPTISEDDMWGWRMDVARLPSGVKGWPAPGLSEKARTVIEVRLSAAKASVKKFAVIAEQGAA